MSPKTVKSPEAKNTDPVTYPLELILPEEVKSPNKFKSSLKLIPATSSPVDWKLSAIINPEALILDAVIAQLNVADEFTVKVFVQSVPIVTFPVKSTSAGVSSSVVSLILPCVKT